MLVNEHKASDVEVVIRPAEGIERRMCCMLLPGISSAPGEVWYLAAVEVSSGKVIGAAGVRELKDQATRWVVDLHVIKPSRLQGVGTKLMESIVAAAAKNEVAVVDAWTMPVDGSERMQLQKFGFQIYKKLYEFETSAREILEAAQPVYNRVTRRGGIPAAARLISLKDADMPAVIALHTAYLGGTANGLIARLRGGVVPFEPHLSLVLLVEERVMGVALGHLQTDPKIYEFDALVIHPSLRSGWASALLRYEQARRGVALGCELVRYMTLDQKLGARHSGKRTPSRLIRTSYWMRQTVSIPSEHLAGGARPDDSGYSPCADGKLTPAQDSIADPRKGLSSFDMLQ
jgi:GNAT superfamily N-acetyltransferase